MHEMNIIGAKEERRKNKRKGVQMKKSYFSPHILYLKLIALSINADIDWIRFQLNNDENT